MSGQPDAPLPLAFFVKPTHWMLICINRCEIGSLDQQFTSMVASILPDLNCTPPEDLMEGSHLKVRPQPTRMSMLWLKIKEMTLMLQV